jgi:hypothetical protein
MEGRKRLLKGLGVVSRWQANSTKRLRLRLASSRSKNLKRQKNAKKRKIKKKYHNKNRKNKRIALHFLNR